MLHNIEETLSEGLLAHRHKTQREVRNLAKGGCFRHAECRTPARRLVLRNTQDGCKCWPLFLGRDSTLVEELAKLVRKACKVDKQILLATKRLVVVLGDDGLPDKEGIDQVGQPKLNRLSQEYRQAGSYLAASQGRDEKDLGAHLVKPPSVVSGAVQGNSVGEKGRLWGRTVG